jgi:hypothetical protein
MNVAKWWAGSWAPGQGPDTGWECASGSNPTWYEVRLPIPKSDDVVLRPLEARFGDQVRSRERVRDLAEVFTDKREIDAMLNLIPDAFSGLDIKFLEPTCGSGNFLVEILSRKLKLVTKESSCSQEHYEHRHLRAVASIYGLDISPENVSDSRERVAHQLVTHFQTEAPSIIPTEGFLNAAALIIESNIVLGDSIKDADSIEFCDWQPQPNGYFIRVWSAALVPESERSLFWGERIQDQEPIYYRDLKGQKSRSKGAAK